VAAQPVGGRQPGDPGARDQDVHPRSLLRATARVASVT
jgi:hypothetical protein